jgi:hypothetical protein
MKSSVSVLLLFVLLAGALSNLRLSSRIKTSLTNTEREFADIDNAASSPVTQSSFELDVSNFSSTTLIKFNFLDQTLETNSSLNFLYRAHSPPIQA